MELNGEDKRIRALFCELKREEERTSPLFAKTWNIAEAEFHRSGFSRLRFQSLCKPSAFRDGYSGCQFGPGCDRPTAEDICDCLASLASQSTTMPNKQRRPAPAPPLKSLRGLERFRLTGNQVSQLIGWWQFADQSALRNHRSHLLSVRARSNKTSKTGFPSGSRQPRNCCAQPAMNCLGSFRK